MLFDDPPKVGKGEKHRGGVVIRVNADYRQNVERFVCNEDDGAGFIVEKPERRNAALRDAQVFVQPFGRGKAELARAERRR